MSVGAKGSSYTFVTLCNYQLSRTFPVLSRIVWETWQTEPQDTPVNVVTSNRCVHRVTALRNFLLQARETVCISAACLPKDKEIKFLSISIPYVTSKILRKLKAVFSLHGGWNFNFGNTPLDWIQELLEWRANAAGRMWPSPTYIHNGSGPSRNGRTQ